VVSLSFLLFCFISTSHCGIFYHQLNRVSNTVQHSVFEKLTLI
jgi:hypothetical protein